MSLNLQFPVLYHFLEHCSDLGKSHLQLSRIFRNQDPAGFSSCYGLYGDRLGVQGAPPETKLYQPISQHQV